jgi:benzoyl-CoA reductase subunit BamB
LSFAGTGDVNVARPAEFMELCNEVLEYIKFRNDNPIPGVMPILAGLGSPQEMKVHDEKWHTENFMWGNSRTRRKDFWTDEIAQANGWRPGQHAHPADQLL